jgi:Winged helix DNA-binding domain
MRLTARQLNRATLGRQLLLERAAIGTLDAVRAVCAIQAQSPASPYIALWNRVSDFDPAELDRAYATQAVVKATLMRATLHAVTCEDYPAFQAAMAHDLRRSRLFDARFTALGLSIDDAEALVPPTLAFAAGTARTNAELETMLAARVGDLPPPGIWWAMRTFAPLVHAPTGGPWSFGDRPSYLTPPTEPFAGTRDEALAVLVRRYLEAFGPASEADFGQFTTLPRPRMRAAIGLLGDDLVSYEGPDGEVLYDVRGMALPSAEGTAPPRLLPMWDSILLAYRDRSRVLPEAYRRVVIRTNGDTLPTILVDGHVAGAWRPAPDLPGAIEVTAFHALDEPTWDGLAAEAGRLVTFVAERQPDVYRRYGRWWPSLPTADMRVL